MPIPIPIKSKPIIVADIIMIILLSYCCNVCCIDVVCLLLSFVYGISFFSSKDLTLTCDKAAKKENIGDEKMVEK